MSEKNEHGDQSRTDRERAWQERRVRRSWEELTGARPGEPAPWVTFPVRERPSRPEGTSRPEGAGELEGESA